MQACARSAYSASTAAASRRPDIQQIPVIALHAARTPDLRRLCIGVALQLHHDVNAVMVITQSMMPCTQAPNYLLCMPRTTCLCGSCAGKTMCGYAHVLAFNQAACVLTRRCVMSSP